MKKDSLFVGSQALLGLLYFVDAQTNIIAVEFPPAFRVIGIFLSLAGVIVLIFALLQLSDSLSPFPTPKTDARLVTSGMYRYVRHPIYMGILVAALGVGLSLASMWKLVVTLALLILFYFKARYEEQLLQEKFAEYREYQKKILDLSSYWIIKSKTIIFG